MGWSMLDFLRHLLDTSGFPARWRCGNWTAGHGWLHILSDLGVWSAYVAMSCVLGYFIVRKMKVIIFWWPAYRLAGVIKLVTALVS
jgi:hypothetical protein